MIHGERGLTIINRVPARRYVPLHRIAMSVRPRVVLREIAAGVLWANLVQGGMMRGGALFDVVFMSMGRCANGRHGIMMFWCGSDAGYADCFLPSDCGIYRACVCYRRTVSQTGCYVR